MDQEHSFWDPYSPLTEEELEKEEQADEETWIPKELLENDLELLEMRKMRPLVPYPFSVHWNRLAAPATPPEDDANLSQDTTAAKEQRDGSAPEKSNQTEAFRANDDLPSDNPSLPQPPPAEEQETTGMTFEQAIENARRRLANDPEMQAIIKALPPPITGWLPDLNTPGCLDEI